MKSTCERREGVLLAWSNALIVALRLRCAPADLGFVATRLAFIILVRWMQQEWKNSSTELAQLTYV